jgi:hypothetical protein
MLELRLRSGQVVAFDGRVVEVFGAGEPSGRFHLAQLDALEAVEGADGTNTVELEEGAVTVVFAEEEAPACARLLAAIAQAQAALARPVAR